MKDLGILMTPANREATVEGRKTMTRRWNGLEEINKDPDAWFYIDGEGFYCADERGAYNVLTVKPPCAVGQRLYLKEPHYRYGKWYKDGKTKTGKQAWRFVPLFEDGVNDVLFEQSMNGHVRTNSYRYEGWYLRSPLFMPKEFARTWLLVTDVKAPERGKDINRKDAIAEGISELFTEDEMVARPELRGEGISYTNYLWHGLIGKTITAAQADAWAWQYSSYTDDPIGSFLSLLTSIYGNDAMEKYYFPIEFKKIEKD